MKKTIAMLLLALALLGLASCAPQVQQAPSATPPVQGEDATAPPPSAQPQSTPAIEMKQVQLEGFPLSIAMPIKWEGNVALTPLETENPDIAATFAIRFAPEGIELTQEGDVGKFFVLADKEWDAIGDKFDFPVVKIGSASGYTVAYSGARDNPYVVDSAQEKLFAQLMFSNADARESMSVKAP